MKYCTLFITQCIILTSVYFLYCFIFSNLLVASECDSFDTNADIICGPDYASSGSQANISNQNLKYQNGLLLYKVYFIFNDVNATVDANADFTIKSGLNCDDVNDCNTNNASNLAYSGLKLFTRSTFSHGIGSINSKTILADNVDFQIYNSSSLSLGQITDMSNDNDLHNNDPVHPAFINFDIENSDLFITQIILNQQYSSITSLKIENTDAENGINLHNAQISGAKDPNNPNKTLAIKARNIGDIILTNSRLKINGDIELLTGIGTLELSGAKLTINGDINAENAISYANLERSTLDIAGDISFTTISVNSNSQLNMQDMQLKAPGISINSNINSTTNINDIYLGDYTNFISFNANTVGGASLNINTFDLTGLANISTNNKRSYTFNSNQDSEININHILIDDPKLQNNIKFAGSIGQIDYYNTDTIIILGDNTTNDLTIDSIVIHDDNTQNSTVELNTTDFEATIHQLIVESDKTLALKIIINENEQDSESNLNFININNQYGSLIFGDQTTQPLSLYAENIITNGDIIITNVTGSISNKVQLNGILNLQKSDMQLHNLSGTVDQINLINSQLVIDNNQNTKVTLNGDIIIDSTSSLQLLGNGLHIEQNDSGQITNTGGKLTISSSNSFGTLNNIQGETFINDGTNSFIAVYNKNGAKLNISAPTTIDDLYNTDSSDLIIKDSTNVNSLHQSSDSTLYLYIDDYTEESLLHIHDSMVNNLLNGEVIITLETTSILKPGLHNYYYLLQTDQGPIMTAPDLENHINITPPWINYYYGIDDNNGTNSSDGQTAWIDIQRLTNYQELIAAVPGANNDNGLKQIAELIDKQVITNHVTNNLEDVINSLDYNSSCDDEEWLYDAHQGDTIIDIENAPCLYNLADNMSTLKPVHSEIYTLLTHNTVNSVFQAIETHNTNERFIDSISFWNSLDIGYSSLSDQNYITGYKNLYQNLYIGLSYNLLNTFNITSALGVGYASVSGNHHLYDSDAFNINASMMGSYQLDDYYFSLGGVLNIANYYTSRNMEFLNNEYSDNNNTQAKSSPKSYELALKAIAKYEILLHNDLYFTPKASLLTAFINNAAYEEKDTSANLKVQSSVVNLYELTAGFDIYKELIYGDFLATNASFIQPTASVELVDRIYKTPTTNVNFVDLPDASDQITISGAGYQGLGIRTNVGILYEYDTYLIYAEYRLEKQFTGLLDTGIFASLKYQF